MKTSSSDRSTITSHSCASDSTTWSRTWRAKSESSAESDRCRTKKGKLKAFLLLPSLTNTLWRSSWKKKAFRARDIRKKSTNSTAVSAKVRLRKKSSRTRKCWCKAQLMGSTCVSLRMDRPGPARRTRFRATRTSQASFRERWMSFLGSSAASRSLSSSS